MRDRWTAVQPALLIVAQANGSSRQRMPVNSMYVRSGADTMRRSTPSQLRQRNTLPVP